MFGDNPFQDGEGEDDEENDYLNDPFAEDPIEQAPNKEAQFGGGVGGGGRLPWEELPDNDAEKIKQESQTPMCEHDSDREVITKQTGAGVQIAGTGSNVTQTVTKVVCPTCGGEWDTWDGSNQTERQDPFSF
jgi:hypothetical protein